MKTFKQNLSSVLSLFTSFSTLLCCALPTLLVTLGLGAVVASTVSAVPLLMTLSRHKGWAFLVAGFALTINFVLVHRQERRNTACAVNPNAGVSACDVAGRWNKRVMWVSVAIYLIGFTVAYVAFPVLTFFHAL